MFVIEIAGSYAAMNRGVTQRPVDIGAATQDRQFDGVGHLLNHAFGAERGRLFEPHRCARSQGQEQLFGCAAGADPVVTGNLVAVAREVTVVDRGASRCGAAVAGDFHGTPVVKGTDHDLVGAVVMTDPHTLTQ